VAPYFLPHHVHFCIRNDSVIFLDVRRDDYTLIEGMTSLAFRRLCLPCTETGDERPSMEALQELVREGLLTDNPHEGKAIAPTSTEIATVPLVDSEDVLRAQINGRHSTLFLVACIATSLSLRLRPLEQIVASLRRERERAGSHQRLDQERARTLTAVFHKLRSLYPRNYLCLFDSLALLRFLAFYRVFPDWVFGARLEPWAAHCWVQHEDLLFNEDPEIAAAYTPVMAI
jgi:hypothetical protein